MKTYRASTSAVNEFLSETGEQELPETDQPFGYAEVTVAIEDNSYTVKAYEHAFIGPGAAAVLRKPDAKVTGELPDGYDPEDVLSSDEEGYEGGFVGRW